MYSLPDKSWREFSNQELPRNWNLTPVPQTVKEWGTKQLSGARFLALRVPSVIIPTEFNFILNTLSPDFKKIRIKEVHKFTFDRRIKR